MKLVFPLLGHPYQILHSLPIAAAVAWRFPETEVHVTGLSAEHIDFAQRLSKRHASDARLHFDLLDVPTWLRVRWTWLSGLDKRYAPGKSLLLFRNRNYFRRFDALITAERTSLLLRRWGLYTGRMIYTTHGAGDREISTTPELSEFDFLLLAGRKHEQRLRELQRIWPGRYETGVYAKLDWLNAKTQPSRRLFANDRRTVLYAPHFSVDESSWFHVGEAVLEQLASSCKFNLVFAPHVRLFAPPTRHRYRAFARFSRLPHMLIDLGSERCIDMTYTRGADLYLGDVSSQVVEFLARPRPCVFLNTRAVDWRGDKSYRFWQCGPVLDSVDDLEARLERAFNSHGQFLDVQQQYVADTFGSYPLPEGMADRAADAIMGFLRSEPPTSSERNKDGRPDRQRSQRR